VDARRPGLLSCAHSELRDHTLHGRRCQDHFECHHGHHHLLRRHHHHSHAEVRPIPIPFARYLEQQNLDYPYQKLPVGEGAAPTPPCDAPGAPPTIHIQPRHYAEPSVSRPDVPRLGDVTPVERTAAETKLRVIYRIEAPLNTGRILDLLV
jgi:hypothetical protein